MPTGLRVQILRREHHRRHHRKRPDIEGSRLCGPLVVASKDGGVVRLRDIADHKRFSREHPLRGVRQRQGIRKSSRLFALREQTSSSTVDEIKRELHCNSRFDPCKISNCWLRVISQRRSGPPLEMLNGHWPVHWFGCPSLSSFSFAMYEPLLFQELRLQFR